MLLTAVPGADGVRSVDGRAAGVVAAGVLAALRVPTVLCVIAGAATAALLRHFADWA